MKYPIGGGKLHSADEVDANPETSEWQNRSCPRSHVLHEDWTLAVLKQEWVKCLPG